MLLVSRTFTSRRMVLRNGRFVLPRHNLKWYNSTEQVTFAEIRFGIEQLEEGEIHAALSRKSG